MKKKICMLLLILLIAPTFVYADAAIGDSIVVLGEDLTTEQERAILSEFSPPDGAQKITVSNEEEHKYLEGVVPKAQIGSNALSSVMVTYTEKGSGITVETSKINYISEQTYINSLVTAGISDADIKITAPFEVSGTAALTGIMKAYEISTGEKISDEVKKIANEEMVTTAELGEEIGDENATEIINKIKEEVAEKQPQTTEEIRDIVINVVNNFNISLTDAQMEQLVGLFDKMKDLNIDWNQVSDQLKNLAGKASDYLSTEEGQGFLQGIKSFLNGLIDWIASLFR